MVLNERKLHFKVTMSAAELKVSTIFTSTHTPPPPHTPILSGLFNVHEHTPNIQAYSNITSHNLSKILFADTFGLLVNKSTNVLLNFIFGCGSSYVKT